MSKARYEEILSLYAKAISRLDEALKRDDADKLIIDGTIQRFEFCVELAWKTIKKILEDKELIKISSPKEAINKAYQLGWIEDEQLWVDMLLDRNQTSHTYKEKLALEIFHRIKSYYPELKKLNDYLQDM